MHGGGAAFVVSVVVINQFFRTTNTILLGAMDFRNEKMLTWKVSDQHNCVGDSKSDVTFALSHRVTNSLERFQVINRNLYSTSSRSLFRCAPPTQTIQAGTSSCYRDEAIDETLEVDLIIEYWRCHAHEFASVIIYHGAVGYILTGARSSAFFTLSMYDCF